MVRTELKLSYVKNLSRQKHLLFNSQYCQFEIIYLIYICNLNCLRKAWQVDLIVQFFTDSFKCSRHMVFYSIYRNI